MCSRRASIISLKIENRKLKFFNTEMWRHCALSKSLLHLTPHAEMRAPKSLEQSSPATMQAIKRLDGTHRNSQAILWFMIPHVDTPDAWKRLNSAA